MSLSLPSLRRAVLAALALSSFQVFAITISPTSPTVREGAKQQFTSSVPAAWKTSCSSITSTGLFTASLFPGSCIVTATATNGSGSASTVVHLVSPIVMTPASARTPQNQTQQFTASMPVSWIAKCGSINAGGLYTASGPVGTTCTIEGIATGSPKYTVYGYDVATVSSSAPVTISPSRIALHAIATKQFTANQPVTWSASCGSISKSGLFTAPTSSRTCTITATAVSDTTHKGTATATISVVNYTTWRNTISGTGLQANEFLLTPASLTAGKFVPGWSASVDGGVWGQPLYLNGIAAGGKTRNLLFVTTSNDSVYAFDADTGAQIWKKSFLSTGVTPVAGSSVSLNTQTGILSTPVIDSGKHILYVVAETSEHNATYFPHRLHALDVITGNEKSGSPVLINDPALAPVYKLQRPGLLLANNTIYIGFGSILDREPYHGLLFGFDATTLARKSVFNVTPTGSEGGIWMSAASPSADSAGNIYISTGNGTVDGTNSFGESIVKLSPQLQELDYFAPFESGPFNKNDVDLGAGSVLVVPDQPGPFRHELIACGKPTPIYLLNRDSLGERGTTSDHILQRLDHQLGNTGNFRDSGQPCFSSPAMWMQHVYFVANHDVMKMFNLSTSTGLLSTTPVSKGTFTYFWPGAEPVVSSNGDTSGIVWTIDLVNSTLRANDATNVSKVLFVSPKLGAAIRWTVPTVANGHVYVGLQGKVVSYSVSPTP